MTNREQTRAKVVDILTPLHEAGRYEDSSNPPETVKLIVDAGADAIMALLEEVEIKIACSWCRDMYAGHIDWSYCPWCGGNFADNGFKQLTKEKI